MELRWLLLLSLLGPSLAWPMAASNVTSVVQNQPVSTVFSEDAGSKASTQTGKANDNPGSSGGGGGGAASKALRIVDHGLGHLPAHEIPENGQTMRVLYQGHPALIRIHPGDAASPHAPPPNPPAPTYKPESFRATYRPAGNHFYSPPGRGGPPDLSSYANPFTQSQSSFEPEYKPSVVSAPDFKSFPDRYGSPPTKGFGPSFRVGEPNSFSFPASIGQPKSRGFGEDFKFPKFPSFPSFKGGDPYESYTYEEVVEETDSSSSPQSTSTPTKFDVDHDDFGTLDTASFGAPRGFGEPPSYGFSPAKSGQGYGRPYPAAAGGYGSPNVNPYTAAVPPPESQAGYGEYSRIAPSAYPAKPQPFTHPTHPLQYHTPTPSFHGARHFPNFGRLRRIPAPSYAPSYNNGYGSATPVFGPSHNDKGYGSPPRAYLPSYFAEPGPNSFRRPSAAYPTYGARGARGIGGPRFGGEGYGTGLYKPTSVPDFSYGLEDELDLDEGEVPEVDIEGGRGRRRRKRWAPLFPGTAPVTTVDGASETPFFHPGFPDSHTHTHKDLDTDADEMEEEDTEDEEDKSEELDHDEFDYDYDRHYRDHGHGQKRKGHRSTHSSSYHPGSHHSTPHYSSDVKHDHTHHHHTSTPHIHIYTHGHGQSGVIPHVHHSAASIDYNAALGAFPATAGGAAVTYIGGSPGHHAVHHIHHVVPGYLASLGLQQYAASPHIHFHGYGFPGNPADCDPRTGRILSYDPFSNTPPHLQLQQQGLSPYELQGLLGSSAPPPGGPPPPGVGGGGGAVGFENLDSDDIGPNGEHQEYETRVIQEHPHAEPRIVRVLKTVRPEQTAPDHTLYRGFRKRSYSCTLPYGSCSLVCHFSPAHPPRQASALERQLRTFICAGDPDEELGRYALHIRHRTEAPKHKVCYRSKRHADGEEVKCSRIGATRRYKCTEFEYIGYFPSLHYVLNGKHHYGSLHGVPRHSTRLSVLGAHHPGYKHQYRVPVPPHHGPGGAKHQAPPIKPLPAANPHHHQRPPPHPLPRPHKELPHHRHGGGGAGSYLPRPDGHPDGFKLPGLSSPNPRGESHFNPFKPIREPPHPLPPPPSHRAGGGGGRERPSGPGYQSRFNLDFKDPDFRKRILSGRYPGDPFGRGGRGHYDEVGGNARRAESGAGSKQGESDGGGGDDDYVYYNPTSFNYADL